MIPPCLTLGNIRYVSRVKWSNPWKGVAPSPTPQCSSYWKVSLLVILDYRRQLYLYIYIYCHPQTDCFVLSELFSVARHVGRSKPGSKPIQLYVRLSLRPLGQQAYHVWLRELLRYLTVAAVCLHFYTLSATRELNSFEELCIMRAAADIPSPECSTPMGERI